MAIRLSDYVMYFEMIAKHHKSIDNFYQMELEQVLLGTRGSAKGYTMILESYDYSYTDGDSDNVTKKREGAFIVMGVENDPGNYLKIQTLREECERIGDDIVKMMYRHKASKQVPLLQYFDLNSVNGQFVEVKANKEYGMRFSFGIDSKEGNEVDANRWDGIDDIVVVNDYGFVKLSGQFVNQRNSTPVNLSLVDGETYRYSTNSVDDIGMVQITNKSGYILNSPNQIDVQVKKDGAYYDVYLTSYIGNIDVVLRYGN